ncbi:MAG TPA: zinc ribbon domain-containing protein [Chloroflexota bacterium]|nr:zinc ribbon domain-containing protein [Chloroflexota bacterium]
MIACPACGEPEPENLIFCDQCGSRLHPPSGLLMLGPSLQPALSATLAGGEGEGPSNLQAAPAAENTTIPEPEPQRFVPVASWPALRAAE